MKLLKPRWYIGNTSSQNVNNFACLLVTTVSCAKSDEPIEMPFRVWVEGSSHRDENTLGVGPDPSREMGNFFGGEYFPAHCEVQRISSVKILILFQRRAMYT